MEKNVRLSEAIVLAAKRASEANDRTVKEQLEHWIQIGRLVEDNPKLTYEFIRKSVKTSSSLY